MTDKRVILVLPVLALLAACNNEAPADDGRSASGEVLEGTISDAMLPLDRVQSEPPLEDPEAFAKAQSDADKAASEAAPEGEATETEDAEPAVPAAEPAQEPEG